MFGTELTKNKIAKYAKVIVTSSICLVFYLPPPQALLFSGKFLDPKSACVGGRYSTIFLYCTIFIIN